MSHALQAALVSVLVIATSIWVGGYVTIVMVARATTKTLPPAQRVAFFRAFGRLHGVVSVPALILGLGAGSWLLADRDYDRLLAAATAVAAALLVTLIAGVVQARRLTRLRQRAVTDASGELDLSIGRSARRAVWLRAGIGALSVALVVLGSVAATS